MVPINESSIYREYAVPIFLFHDCRYERLLNSYNALEEKLKEKDDTIYALKESLTRRPETKMQSDMNLLLLEKVWLWLLL